MDEEGPQSDIPSKSEVLLSLHDADSSSSSISIKETLPVPESAHTNSATVRTKEALEFPRLSNAVPTNSSVVEPLQKENADGSHRIPQQQHQEHQQYDENMIDAEQLESKEIIAKGIACALGAAMQDFDARAEGALKSQGVLKSSIDRLTRELDKLLEDAPLPCITQHATKLAGLCKRVQSLNSTLQLVQRRIDNIDRMLFRQDCKSGNGFYQSQGAVS